jgi:hypothetical protein
MKRWVKQKTTKTVDGDLLHKVIVYECKPRSYSYIVFTKK